MIYARGANSRAGVKTQSRDTRNRVSRAELIAKKPRCLWNSAKKFTKDTRTVQFTTTETEILSFTTPFSFLTKFFFRNHRS